jgi:hypothetical protein
VVDPEDVADPLDEPATQRVTVEPEIVESPPFTVPEMVMAVPVLPPPPPPPPPPPHAVNPTNEATKRSGTSQKIILEFLVVMGLTLFYGLSKNSPIFCPSSFQWTGEQVS